MAEDATVTLPDGRRVAFRHAGPADGTPVVYAHGLPGSRLEPVLDDHRLAARGWRLIVPERAGYGLSDRRRGRRVADWPADVVAIADHLGLGRFAVLGYSGGGPFALACGALIASRISAVGVVSGAGVPGQPGYYRGMARGEQAVDRVGRVSPALASLAFALVRRDAVRHPQRFYASLERELPAVDRAIARSPGAREAVLASFLESTRAGTGGIADDLRALLRLPWGFEFDAVAPPVRLWFGDADRIIPPSQGRHLASALPGSVAEEVPGAGHLMVVDRLESLIGELLDAAVARGDT